MEVSPKGPLSHLQCQVCKHLGAQAIKLPNGAGGWDLAVEGSSTCTCRELEVDRWAKADAYPLMGVPMGALSVWCGSPQGAHHSHSLQRTATDS